MAVRASEPVDRLGAAIVRERRDGVEIVRVNGELELYDAADLDAVHTSVPLEPLRS